MDQNGGAGKGADEGCQDKGSRYQEDDPGNGPNSRRGKTGGPGEDGPHENDLAVLGGAPLIDEGKGAAHHGQCVPVRVHRLQGSGENALGQEAQDDKQDQAGGRQGSRRFEIYSGEDEIGHSRRCHDRVKQKGRSAGGCRSERPAVQREGDGQKAEGFGEYPGGEKRLRKTEQLLGSVVAWQGEQKNQGNPPEMALIKFSDQGHRTEQPQGLSEEQKRHGGPIESDPTDHRGVEPAEDGKIVLGAVEEKQIPAEPVRVKMAQRLAGVEQAIMPDAHVWVVEEPDGRGVNHEGEGSAVFLLQKGCGRAAHFVSW